MRLKRGDFSRIFNRLSSELVEDWWTHVGVSVICDMNNESRNFLKNLDNLIVWSV